MIKKNTFFLFFLFLSATSLFSQQMWVKTSKQTIQQQKKEVLTSNITSGNHVLMNLDIVSFKNVLNTNANTITLPTYNGKIKEFTFNKTSYLAPELAAKFPQIQSFSAHEVGNPAVTAKISIGKNGVHAMIFTPNKSTLYIDPYTSDYKEYIIYKKDDLTALNDFTCKLEDEAQKKSNSSFQNKNANDSTLRTFRTAIACTGEYSQFHLNQQGIPDTASEADKKAAVLSAINTTMTRVNGVFERDLAVRMVLVSNNDELIFLDADTDGLSNNNAGALIDESQDKCDAIIGDANYDLGHTFSTGGGGLAQLGSVCITGHKAKGITGRGQPIDDAFDIDYVAHEIGHQFGANHTFNNSCSGNRSQNAAVEPGSGSTIMGYAGICSPNVQNVSDDYFHAISIEQMWNNIQANSTCAALSNINNAAPTATTGADVSIPKLTPFILKGQSTDADGNASLTYTWEQMDNEIATMSPLSTNTGGPMFRSLAPSSSPDRYMPALSTVLSGNTSTTWEVLPSVARDLNFAFLVRDNNAGGGSSARDDIKVTIVDTDPFTVTNPSSSVSWGTGSTQTITWSAGTSNQAPINCENVNIKLSTDGGQTFPIILKSNTPNDGSEDIVIPNNATTNARILVEAADNIFYNINNTNFTIFQADPTFSLENITGDLSACNQGTNEVVFELEYKALFGFTNEVTLSTSGKPVNSTATLNPTTLSNSGNFTLTMGNLNDVAPGDYNITVTGTSSTTTKSVNILLNINDSLCNSSGNTESQVSITNVTFNAINNDSNKTSGYSDFKAINTKVVRGESYDLTTAVNAGGSTVKTFAWVDWNQNCVFDSNETYEITSNTVSITVPEDAPLGSTTLRVAIRPEINPNSCGLNYDGEVEDYTINVEEKFATTETLFDDLAVYPIPYDGELTISFTVKEKDATTLRLFDFRGRLVETQEISTISSSFNKQVQFKTARSGFYLLQIENAGKLTTKKIFIK